ncbi:MAG: xanthine dehydrogenase family protein molybdopterin-binding subunit [Cryobacterium sp.]|nr:xanthine dehydrogenase family protein molybdopterin-binding subunit [Oligoflexia bacterium]
MNKIETNSTPSNATTPLLERPLERREFLIGSLTAVGTLTVAFTIPSPFRKFFAAEISEARSLPNAFVRVAPDNSITLVMNKLEMGQGVNTSLSQLIAEELECDWKSIRTEFAPVDAVYNAVGMPMQMTGGSASMKTSWDQHRKIGAGMREMLKSAAAAKWGIPVSGVKAENGSVIRLKDGAHLSYGELAEAASHLPFPENPPLKKAKDFKIIGKSPNRIDAAEKVNGKAIYGIDVRIPGMLYASVTRPSMEKAKLLTFDRKAARKIAGVVDVVSFGNKIAVLGKNTYAARLGCEALKPTWDYGANAHSTTETVMSGFKKDASQPGIVAETRGAVGAEMAKAKRVLTFEYEFPYLAHAPMEPMNCTIDYDGKKAELWSGHQMPTIDLGAAAKTLGLAPEKVKIHTVFAGGSFGRRASKTSDYVVEACELAKKVKKPLKITWSREDDMRGGYYRPMYFHAVKVGLNEKNEISAWDHRVVGQSIMANSPMASFMKGGIDKTVVEGVTESAYKLANFECRQILTEAPFTTLWWRSVGNTHTAYVMETMIDELAEAAGSDPFKYRRRLLKDSPRHLAVLDLLEKRVKENLSTLEPGRAWGLAIHESFASVVGHVAEISLVNGSPRVHRVFSAVHCGQVVHPEIAKSQVEGAVIFGISSLFQEVALKDGVIPQTNFDTYPVLRIQDAPVITVDFVETDAPPTGLGEPGVPPIAPAVANALYRLTKARLRILPFKAEVKA